MWRITSIGWSSGVSRIARSTASESSMLMELDTGTPNSVTVSWRLISAMTRDLRCCWKRSSTDERAVSSRLDP